MQVQEVSSLRLHVRSLEAIIGHLRTNSNDMHRKMLNTDADLAEAQRAQAAAEGRANRLAAAGEKQELPLLPVRSHIILCWMLHKGQSPQAVCSVLGQRPLPQQGSCSLLLPIYFKHVCLGGMLEREQLKWIMSCPVCAHRLYALQRFR